MDSSNDSNLRETLASNSNKRNPFKQLYIIISVIVIFLVISIVSIIFLLKSNNEKIYYNEIICLYKIDDISNEISILGNEFENINNTIIKIIHNF